MNFLPYKSVSGHQQYSGGSHKKAYGHEYGYEKGYSQDKKHSAGHHQGGTKHVVHYKH